MAEKLTADIPQIRALVTTVDDVSTQIDALDIRTHGAALANAFPGSEIGAACAQAGEFTEGAWLRVAQRFHGISTAMTDCANQIDATDEDFKKALDTMRFKALGAN